MKNNNMMTFIIVAGVIILSVFTVVVTINFLPDNESNSYYVKTRDEMSAKIESVNIVDNKLIINTSGSPIEYCVKTTKSIPNDNSICWKKINDNYASISVFPYRTYYVWIKDDTGNISNYININSND